MFLYQSRKGTLALIVCAQGHEYLIYHYRLLRRQREWVGEQEKDVESYHAPLAEGAHGQKREWWRPWERKGLSTEMQTRSLHYTAEGGGTRTAWRLGPARGPLICDLCCRLMLQIWRAQNQPQSPQGQFWRNPLGEQRKAFGASDRQLGYTHARPNGFNIKWMLWAMTLIWSDKQSRMCSVIVREGWHVEGA